MNPVVLQRQRLVVPALAAGAALYGAMVATQPQLAAGFLGAALVAWLAFAAPVAHLCALLFLTVVVPYSINNRYFGAGAGQAGLLLSDVFILTGLARAVLVLGRERLDPRRLTAIGLTTAFCLWVLVAARKGVDAGQGMSDVGVEARALIAFSVVIVTLAVLDDVGARERLMRGLVVLGLLLGLWGLMQWFVGFSFDSDFGVRAGVSYATEGRGQVQGGLFAFPVAVIIAAAALMSGHLRTRTARLWVLAVLALNLASLLLTFERTFWVVTVLGVMVVLLRSGRARRLRSAMWLVCFAIVAMASVSVAAPATLQTARERLLSIGQHSSDDSLRYRRVESEHVVKKIHESPLTGSGLADTIWWGRPWQQVPPTVEHYSHNGYLWLTWRLGLLGTALLLGLFGLAMTWRGPPAGSPLFATIRIGAQASLLALLVSSITFPTFNGYGITAAMAVLIGICALPREPRTAGEGRAAS
jgi:O-antigen ligase